MEENPNKSLIKRRTKKVSEGTAKMVFFRIQIVEDILKILTPEQREFVRSKMQKSDPKTEILEVLIKTFNLPELEL